MSCGSDTTRIAKEKKADSFFFANSGGNVRGGPNLDRLGKTIAWFQADNQGRTYEDPAVWGCSLQGRVCNAVLDGKFAANVTAAYSTGNPGWRNASRISGRNSTCGSTKRWPAAWRPTTTSSARRQALARTAAGRKSALDYFHWTARHDAHFATRRSIANIGVVIGQSTQLLYPGPASMRSRTLHARDHAGHLRRAAAGPFRI